MSHTVSGCPHPPHTHTRTQPWHKACFTCEVCNLKLTMKTYKGYNKLPYCNT